MTSPINVKKKRDGDYELELSPLKDHGNYQWGRRGAVGVSFDEDGKVTFPK